MVEVLQLLVEDLQPAVEVWQVISATIRILLSFKSGHVLKLLEPIFTLLEVHMPCSKPLIGD